MKKRLDHLPAGKRDELKFVTQVIREGFAETVSRRTAERLRGGQLLKIILFGSYTREGEWVEDPVGRYFSDYDILVVVDHEDLTDVPEIWAKTEERLLSELAAGARLRTPVSVIYHDLSDVNAQLSRGRYFFTDILRDGVVLFEEQGHPFVDPTPLTPVEALSESQEYFEEWFESASAFQRGAEFFLQEQRPKEAAFSLHQATERFYHCFILVLTLYSPKTHNLNQLRKLSEGMDPRLSSVWPAESKFQKRCYELLRAAYVKARYSRHYRISVEELAWLQERIKLLRSTVRDICEERLKSLRTGP
jgi:predicted nucleotidyltransferase/HEPN domain-containing protein